MATRSNSSTRSRSGSKARSSASRSTASRGTSRGGSRAGSTRSGAKGSSRRAAPARRSRARAPEPSPFLGGVFEGRGREIGGVLLLLAAALVALGVWAGSAGPVGAGLDALTRALVGLLAVVVPVALAALGLVLLVAPHRGPVVDLAEGTGTAAGPADPTTQMPARHGSVAGRVVGGVLAFGVVVGMLHLFAADRASVEADGLDAYAGAGGLLGAGVGGGLAQVLGKWGAFAVLLAVAVLAVSLLSGRSLPQLWSSLVRVLTPAVHRVGDGLSGLFRVGEHAGAGSADATAADGPAIALYDQDADGATAPKRRTRKKSAPKGPQVQVPSAEPAGEPEQLEIELPPGAAGSPWRLPPLKLLSVSGRRDVDTKEVEQRGHQLEKALAEHGVETRLVGMVVGPTVTRYELELGTGVKVSRVTTLHKDIAYAMASPDVRIIAPIPGRQAIGVEVPNEERQVVNLGDILGSAEARAASHPLEVAVGRDITGTSVLMNLATMPHLLIAGQTGAGKSSCINCIITSVMMRSTPDQVRLILIDPKRVELTQYNRIPHLLTQVVANPKKAANALNWAVKEMERRYDLLSEVGVRDITGYNAAFDKGELQAQPGVEREFQRLPFILIVVDELADLMMVAPRDVEDAIIRIAQMARAVGIHLVIATQRPSVNVITGVIKANIPARLAFAVASATDSKVILDQAGAERLVGRGDMLLLGSGTSSPQRIQGAWVEEKEVAKIAETWRRQAPDVETRYVQDVQGNDDAAGPGSTGGGAGSGDGEDDDLLKQATELVVRSQFGSTSMLQRKLKVGFARAGRLMDLLEERGVVGPSEGSKARDVLMTPEQLDELIESGQF
ncbi:MAG: DNA translocase FtsK [Microthrixaceae bacterium]